MSVTAGTDYTITVGGGGAGFLDDEAGEAVEGEDLQTGVAGEGTVGEELAFELEEKGYGWLETVA